jgi:hypothetical protein
MDQESLLPRLMTGLLPAPGGTSGSGLGLSMMGYGGDRSGSNGGSGSVPITVQVVDTVDSVEVTAVPVGSSSSSNGAAAGGKDGGSAAAKSGGSSKGGGGSSGGSGSGGGGSSRSGSAGGSGSASAEQQQQQQLQPVAAAAGAAGGVAYAAAGGARLDAAGMAAGANAQRKGEQRISGDSYYSYVVCGCCGCWQVAQCSPSFLSLILCCSSGDIARSANVCQCLRLVQHMPFCRFVCGANTSNTDTSNTDTS